MDIFNSRLFPIYLVLLVDVLGFTIIFPLLPFYAEHFGASPVAVGALGTIYAVAQLIAGPLLGVWSDHWGRHRVLMLSQIGTLLSFFLLAFAPSFRWLCLARGLDGMTAGNVSVAHAYVADVTVPQERARAFSIMSTVFGIGFIIGPPLSGYLFHFGFQVPILVAAAMSFLSILFTFLFLEKKSQLAPKKVALNPWKQLSALFQTSPVRRRLIQFGLFAFSFSLYFFGLPLFAERRFTIEGHPFGPREMGSLYLVTGVVSLVVQARFMRGWITRYGEEKIVTIGFVLAGGGYALLSVAHEVPILIVSVISLAVANSALRPGLTGLISRHSHSAEQGVTMGALQSFYSLADIISPLFAGWLIGHNWLGPWAMVMSIVALSSGCLWFEFRGKVLWRVLFSSI